MMEKACCWLFAATCFFAGVLGQGAVDDSHVQPNANSGYKIQLLTCQQVCAQLQYDYKDIDAIKACQRQRPSQKNEKEEVIVVSKGSHSITHWKWDTITMVVSSYVDTISKSSLTACIAHSKGKSYGLRELVPGSTEAEMNTLLTGDAEQKLKIKTDFQDSVSSHQKLLLADNMVFDLLHFFHQLDQLTSADNKSAVVQSVVDILDAAKTKVYETHKSEVYCIVPWLPPCPESDCQQVSRLLRSCDVMLMSPDSYMPTADDKGNCRAQATVPLSKFIYGLDRYVALKVQPFYRKVKIVAGIPWHGYTYKCDNLKDDTCLVKRESGNRCFDDTNRRRHSLSEIHSMIIPAAGVKMEEVSKGIYYNVNASAQMWFENYTTLSIKYQLVKDFNLRGLSIWYGEDLITDLSVSNDKYFFGSWDFLTHNVLHKAAFNPVKRQHVYADTMAGVGVGCLLLGTALGVLFTCIAMRHRLQRHSVNRPFKLDEVDEDFRDDEGL